MLTCDHAPDSIAGFLLVASMQRIMQLLFSVRLGYCFGICICSSVTQSLTGGACGCTQVAAGLTDAALAASCCAVRIMLFVGGPITEGRGQVVSKELEDPIRSHKALTTASCLPIDRMSCLVPVSLPRLA